MKINSIAIFYVGLGITWFGITLVIYGMMYNDETDKIDYLISPKMTHIVVTDNFLVITWLTNSLPDNCTVFLDSQEFFIDKYSQFLHRFYIFNLKIPYLSALNSNFYTIQCKIKQTAKLKIFPLTLKSFESNKFIFLADFSTSKIGDKINSQHTQKYKANVLSYLNKDLEGVSSIWHLGDIAYDLFSNDGERGFEFLHDIEPIASKIPYFAVVGNHEVPNNFKHFSSLFQNGLYFVTTYKYLKIIAISSEFAYFSMKPNNFPYKHSYLVYLKQKQTSWLIKTLENIDRNEFPWVIIVAHKPLYCSHNKESSMIKQVCSLQARIMREQFEEIFIKFNVDFGVFGHIHLYERTFPVKYGEKECDDGEDHYFYHPNAPIYVVNGVAGNLEGEKIVFTVTKTPEKWSATIKESLGYGIVTVSNKTHLKYEQISFGENQWDNAFSDFYSSRRIDDFFWIIKD